MAIFHSRKSFAAIAAIVLLINVLPAPATVTYQYVTDQTAYAVAPNATLTINLYLQETVNAGSVSLLASDGGLEGAGILVTRTSGVSSFARLSAETANTGSFSGGNHLNTVVDGSGSFYEGAPVSGGVTATAVPGETGVSRIFLGTVTAATSSGGLNTTFSLSPYVNPNNSVGGNTLTNTSFYDLDTDSTAGSVSFSNTIANPYSFTVSQQNARAGDHIACGLCGDNHVSTPSESAIARQSVSS